MFPHKEAIVRLLQDDDPGTVDLVKQQLAQGGLEAVPDLEDLLKVDDECVSRHAAQVLGKIDSTVAMAELTARCRVFPEEGNLEEACWLLARILMPGVRVEPYRRRLDEWALELRRRLDPTGPARQAVQTLATFLGRELGFTGAADDYYRVDNSLLPQVLDLRRGIPISLTVVYSLVAERAGIAIEGVNFPGHFLARSGDVLFDPYGGGAIVTVEDCEGILGRQSLTLQPSHLTRATPRAMLRRIFANLLYIYQDDEEEAENAERFAHWIRALDPK